MQREKSNQPSLISEQAKQYPDREDALLYSNLIAKLKFTFNLVIILRFINGCYVPI